MGKKRAVLIGIAAGVGIADAVMAHSVYVKKKAVTIRDMALRSIDEALRKKTESADDEASEIPIE